MASLLAPDRLAMPEDPCAPADADANAAIGELATATGLPLDLFRREHVETRIAALVARYRVPSLTQLAALVDRDGAVRADVRRALAISVTGIFRDPEQFDLLARHLLRRPRVQGRHGLRVWSAGCSTGQELWSAAILLDRIGRLEGASLLGSDLLEENVRAARAGLSPADRGGRRVPPVRPRFEVRDLVRDGAPGAAWDVVLCRNVAIYLTTRARRRLHATLCGALRPGGLLLLGRSERLSDPRALGVEPVGPHLYVRTEIS